ncbi:MAG: murein L,D-transpeptidase [Cytophagaceae bacterium]
MKKVIPLILLLLFSCFDKKIKEDEVIKRETPVFVSEPEFSGQKYLDNFLLNHKDDSLWFEHVKNFYKARNYRLAWSDSGIFIPQTGIFINAIYNLDQEGFDLNCFEETDIWELYSAASTSEGKPAPQYVKLREDIDILLTLTFFKYARQIWQGASSPEVNKWHIKKKEVDYIASLNAVLAGKDSLNPLISQNPLHQEYHYLKKALYHYKEIQKSGGWGEIILPEGIEAIQKGDSFLIIREFKKRLYITGDFSSEVENSDFDSDLEKAVKQFQFRHGLDSTGIVNKKTVSEMNIPVESRIRQIAVNMERWRWLPAKGGAKYIAINIPNYMLHAFENNKHAWQMKAIVGKSATNTPVFNSEISHVVFNPSWTAPKSIAVNEILPAIKKNPDYLVNHEMEVFRGGKKISSDSINWAKVTEENFNFTFRQKPGPKNPLGNVKFLFPNNYDVYLHGTPAQTLFTREERGFSHGCIRLESPIKFAEYVLMYNKEITIDKINKILSDGEEKYVRVKNKLPVYIVYLTCWEDSKGLLHFRKDIYGHDKALEKALENLKFKTVN